MNHPTSEQIAKLPVWAKDHIANLERQRDVSVRELNEYCDATTSSPFYIEEMVCTGERQGPSIKKRYIQANNITVDFGGVVLQISANNYNGRRGIELQWDGGDRVHKDVALIPNSYNKIELVSKENMR